MNIFQIIKHTGIFLIYFSLAFLPSVICGFSYGEKGDAGIFLAIAVITAAVGALMYFSSKSETTARKELLRKEGIALVAFCWILAALFGSLPYMFTGVLINPADAFFETMSGFTTTGASVIKDVESLPHALLFWRSFTHWLGGLGIIVLFIVVLPQLGIGGRYLFKSEVPGPSVEGIKPKIKETAVILLKIYLIFTVIETVLLLFGGLDLFEALCHTFGTLATGGFSVKNGSIGAYGSVYVESIIIIFMLIAGANFQLYYIFARKDKGIFLKDVEFRVYFLIILACAIIITCKLYFTGIYSSFFDSLRYSLFQTASIQTTTGYSTANSDLWPPLVKAILLTLMFVGGSGGSTGGGMKVVRAIILVKYVMAEVLRVFRPTAEVVVRVGPVVIRNEVIRSVAAYFLLLIGIFLTGGLVVSLAGNGLVTSFAASAACLNNIGPGFGKVGAILNYAFLPGIVKYFLSFSMLFGRLEIYTLFVLFLPSFWKK